MSRTDKDAPLWVRNLREAFPGGEEFHYGCEHTDGIIDGYDEVEVVSEYRWQTVEKTVESSFSMFPTTTTTTKILTVVVYEPVVTIERVPRFRTVECTIDHHGGRCYRDGLHHRHRCHWPKGSKREFYYSPERAASRSNLRSMMREYNATGELSEEEVFIPPNPHGMWGGGYID